MISRRDKRTLKEKKRILIDALKSEPCHIMQ